MINADCSSVNIKTVTAIQARYLFLVSHIHKIVVATILQQMFWTIFSPYSKISLLLTLLRVLLCGAMSLDLPHLYVLVISDGGARLGLLTPFAQIL